MAAGREQVRRRTDAQVGVDGGVTSRAGQVLVLSVRDVQVGLGVAVLFSQTKVDDIDLVASLSNTHEEVVWLDVAVDEVAGVDVLDAGDLDKRRWNVNSRSQRKKSLSTYELISQKKDRLEGEFALAKVEQILERGAEKVDDHGVVVALDAEPSDEGDADAAGQILVHFGFVLELRVLGFDRL